MEATSAPTIAAVEQELQTSQFSLVVVPDGAPRTKPKALNYAMPMARGEFLVIYDAEDVPAVDQLRRIATIFLNEPAIDCVQAELAIDNARENWLTALFAAEYGGLFGVVLPAFGRWNVPMPLGGTSNHFRCQSLREVGGWDAFNVTEDADLGVRLSRLRYRARTVHSQTWEEAPSTIDAWLRQRTRWMKGWMQTFMVHNRHPRAFARDMGWRNFLIFQVYVGGLIVSAPLHALFLPALLLQLALGHGFQLAPISIWLAIQYMVLVIGYSSAFLLCFRGLRHTGRMDLLGYQLLLPVYWALMGVAAFLAAIELIRHPHFWAKTTHGTSRLPRSAPRRPVESNRRPRRQRRRDKIKSVKVTHQNSGAERLAEALVPNRSMERVKGIEPSS